MCYYRDIYSIQFNCMYIQNHLNLINTCKHAAVWTKSAMW